MGRVYLLLFCILLAGCQKHELIVSSEPSKGWVSSGGEVFEDSSNAWFLQNLKVVKYCIAVDEKTFSAKPARIDELVASAIAYWKKEFEPFGTEATLPRPGAHLYQKTDCDDSTDLRFKFGRGVLSPDEGRFVLRNSQYVSMAVRTNYDRINLRGKGFIYVSSDLGADRYPNSATYVDRPWSYDGLLERVLLHELGHVFGLPHAGEGLMSAQFPEHILKATDHALFTPRYSDERYFAPQDSYRNCAFAKLTAETAYRWFDLKEEFQCLYLKNHSRRNGDLLDAFEFSVSKTPDSPKISLGSIAQKKGDSFQTKVSRAGFLFLPSEQLVFTDPIIKEWKYLPTSLFFMMAWGGTFEPVHGEAKKVMLTMRASGFEIAGFIDDKFQTIFTHNRGCLSVNAYQVCLDP